MDSMEIMKQRHSVRQYKNKKIEDEKRFALENAAAEINKEWGLHIQVIFDEPKCFDSMMAHYGKFSGVSNYIALVGAKSSSLEENCGYYGERIALLAQDMGLNTCWVAMTHGNGAAKIQKDEKQVCLIALGYGENQGIAHKSKPVEDVCNCVNDMPDWFSKGIQAALEAPTAMNQQKFYFSLDKESVTAKVKGRGFYTKIDLGIVKYHFESVSGHEVI